MLLTCINWITDKSNIQSPRRDNATPPINTYADLSLSFTHIEATQTRRKAHCKNLEMD